MNTRVLVHCKVPQFRVPLKCVIFAHPQKPGVALQGAPYEGVTNTLVTGLIDKATALKDRDTGHHVRGKSFRLL
jgi:hypothetical protein